MTKYRPIAKPGIRCVHAVAYAEGPLRLSACAMSCATVPPANWTSTQTATSFRAPSRLSACGSKPSTIRPRPRLSALAKAGRRVEEEGERRQPDVARIEEEPP